MIENLMHPSPGLENGCRRTALSDSGSTIQLTGDNTDKCVRIVPKKWELRRTRSPDKVNETSAGEGGGCLKKKRPTPYVNNDVDCAGEPRKEEEEARWNGKAAAVSLSLAGCSSNQDYVPCCWSHGSISVIGRMREMEDAVAVELGFLTRGSKEKECHYDFFGVYDGHGGSLVAQACRGRLHKLLMQMIREDDDGTISGEGGGGSGINWNKVMLESFKKMDEEVNRNGAEVATMGSTAVVAVVGEEEVVVANCGDSRAVLSRGGTAIPLSIDHKPERPDELERIELSGGKVIDWNGHRVLGVLATSRSIGDNYLEPFVISEPEITVMSRRRDTDEFLILASDGLWDVISNDLACHVARRYLDGHVKRAPREMAAQGLVNHEMESGGGLAAEAASVLAELAIARGSRDNISVIVVQLNSDLQAVELVRTEEIASVPKMRYHCQKDQLDGRLRL